MKSSIRDHAIAAQCFAQHVRAFSCHRDTVCTRPDDIPRVLAEALDCAQSLAELGANDNSAVGGSLGTSRDGGNSISEGASFG